MKSKAARLTLFASIVWGIFSSLLYHSAINRFYRFTPIDAFAVRVISNSDAERYKVTMQNGEIYEFELPSGQTEESLKATTGKAVRIFQKHKNVLSRMPTWLQLSNAVSPVPIVSVRFCYYPELEGEQFLDSSGFRVDRNWLGFSIFLLGPILLLSLLVLIWLRIFPSSQIPKE